MPPNPSHLDGKEPESVKAMDTHALRMHALSLRDIVSGETLLYGAISPERCCMRAAELDALADLISSLETAVRGCGRLIWTSGSSGNVCGQFPQDTNKGPYLCVECARQMWPAIQALLGKTA